MKKAKETFDVFLRALDLEIERLESVPTAGVIIYVGLFAKGMWCKFHRTTQSSWDELHRIDGNILPFDKNVFLSELNYRTSDTSLREIALDSELNHSTVKVEVNVSGLDVELVYWFDETDLDVQFPKVS